MGSKPEILSRLAQTTAALTRPKSVRNDRSFSPRLKIPLMRFLVTSNFLYACGLWTFTAELKKNANHRSEVQPQYVTHLIQKKKKKKVTNEKVCAKIQQSTGPNEDLLIIGKRRKLNWYGYVSRSSVPAKKTSSKSKREGDMADRREGGETRSGTGQAWSSLSTTGQWRKKNGGNML